MAFAGNRCKQAVWGKCVSGVILVCVGRRTKEKRARIEGGGDGGGAIERRQQGCVCVCECQRKKNQDEISDMVHSLCFRNCLSALARFAPLPSTFVHAPISLSIHHQSIFVQALGTYGVHWLFLLLPPVILGTPMRYGTLASTESGPDPVAGRMPYSHSYFSWPGTLSTMARISAGLWCACGVEVAESVTHPEPCVCLRHSRK